MVLGDSRNGEGYCRGNEEYHSLKKDVFAGPSTSNDIDFGYYPSKVVPWATKNYYPLSIDGFVVFF